MRNMRTAIRCACFCGLVLRGCDQTANQTASSNDPMLRLVRGGPPRQACTELPPAPASATVETVVVDTAMGDFEPGRIVDIAVENDSTIFVLDAAMFNVARLTRHGRVLRVWGRKGRGPGEFVDPQAIAFDGERVYVLDADRTVSIFNREGALVRDVRITHPGQDIALSTNGHIVVAADLRQFDHEHGGVVVYDSTGKRTATLVAFDRDKYGSRPFSGPHFTPIRVFSGDDGRVAVAYPTDNSVDVYRDNRLETSIRGCMPSDILKYYRKIFEHNRNAPPMRRYSSYIITINGVYLDPTGDIYVGSPGGWDDLAQITRYGSNGRPVSVREFKEKEPTRFASDAVFLTPNNVIAWDGHVWSWEITPGAAQ